MPAELRPFWNRLFQFNGKFGIFLIAIVCIPRFLLVLKANATGNYGYIGLVMFISALAPFIFLGKQGRQQIGIRRPVKYRWLGIAFIFGLIASLALFLLGKGLYNTTYSNWYVYIGKSYNIPQGIDPHNKLILFGIMASTGMIFSPVGEEFFFRGIVHGAFAKSMGDQKASWVDSTAFALTHISHFGLVFINHQWSFLPIPALLWVLGMFFVSLMFFIFKKHAGSIWGAVVCHAAFNFGMIYCIFYLL